MDNKYIKIFNMEINVPDWEYCNIKKAILPEMTDIVTFARALIMIRFVYYLILLYTICMNG
ncbi:MAG: hypothetical protein JXB50_16885 [Spirochaetes bacterium]|nr:hypothetical protein [Spirochaetota bacterium]